MPAVMALNNVLIEVLENRLAQCRGDIQGYAETDYVGLDMVCIVSLRYIALLIVFPNVLRQRVFGERGLIQYRRYRARDVPVG